MRAASLGIRVSLNCEFSGLGFNSREVEDEKSLKAGRQCVQQVRTRIVHSRRTLQDLEARLHQAESANLRTGRPSKKPAS
jgi:hypothetical protein